MTLTNTPHVTAIIVTWNSGAVIDDLLRSIRASRFEGTIQTVVVDNASTDDTVVRVRQLMPEAIVLQTGRNAGYAAGANVGIALSIDSDAYLLLNPDLRLNPDSLSAMVNELMSTDAGIVVPKLVDQHGGLRYSLRREPTVLRAWGESLLGGRRAGLYPMLGEVETRDEVYARAGPADWATGAAMLVSRECSRRVGSWDETYFLYSEETDFALRARDAGFELRYTPASEVLHYEGESHQSAALFALLTRNRVRLYRSRHGRVRTAVFWLGAVIGEAIRARQPARRAGALALLGQTSVMARPGP
jgi:GT2 family glycosyltransferase